MNSRAKGKRGELELAQALRERGFAARRGRQFNGGDGSPDIVHDLPGNIHVECKRTEGGSPYKWLDQAKADAWGKVPVVMHRRSNREWIVILSLDDFVALLPRA